MWKKKTLKSPFHAYRSTSYKLGDEWTSAFGDMGYGYPSTFPPLISTPEPPAFFSLDNQFIPNSYSKFRCCIIVPGDSNRAVGVKVDPIFGDPAAFPSLVGTPEPHPVGVTVPVLNFLADFESFTSPQRERIWIEVLIVCNDSAYPWLPGCSRIGSCLALATQLISCT